MYTGEISYFSLVQGVLQWWVDTLCLQGQEEEEPDEINGEMVVIISLFSVGKQFPHSLGILQVGLEPKGRVWLESSLASLGMEVHSVGTFVTCVPHVSLREGEHPPLSFSSLLLLGLFFLDVRELSAG